MGLREENTEVREAHKDAFSDFKAVSRLPILAKLSDTAPGSPSTVAAFAGVRRPWAGRAETRAHAKARSREVPALLTNT